MQGPWRIEGQHLAEATAAVRAHARQTPLVDLAALGPGALAKLETEQETGSFKLRGALAALAALDPAARARGVVTASAGNHGYGLARAGAILGVPVTVFVSGAAPRVKREGMERAGARVVAVGAAGYDDVEAEAREAAAREGLPFVSPFDDPRVAAGNGGTIGLELLDALPALRTVVAPVGGGGLVAGLLAALAARGSSARVVGVTERGLPRHGAEPRPRPRADALRRRADAGRGLEGGVSESTFAAAKALWRMEAVSEDAIASAMRFARRELALPLEGSAAVALAWVLAHASDAHLERPLVVILTGRNVDARVLRAIGAADA
ncbi:MAG: pyridoxal-phosphate dependent enzyme [Sandaracinaceae bacterium]|nr:pyridoxal-phosphate dependent enzyme [Sandaracinaceae bacterium]